METMIAYCGLKCDSCLVHLATREQDPTQKRTMRESIAEKCNALYGMDLKPVDVTDCDGCLSNRGKLFSECLNCKIRECAIGKNIDSCAFCIDYGCDELQKHFISDPQSKTRLEEIRQKIRT